MPRKPAVDPDPIGKRIKQIRQFLGKPRRAWSQAELAEKLGMDERTLRRREQKGDLTPDEAKDLAALAHCDVNWIMTGQGRAPGTLPAGRKGAAGSTATYPRGPSGGTAMRVAESDAPAGFDLVEEIVHHPDQFARRMEKYAAAIGVAWTLAWMDGAEKILRQNGLDYSEFLGAIRESLRADRRAAGGENP